MAKQKIEVEVGTIPAKKAKSDEIGRTHPMPQPQGGKSDVSGQWVERRWVQCPHCGAVVSLWYDTERYINYECCVCHGIFTA